MPIYLCKNGHMIKNKFRSGLECSRCRYNERRKLKRQQDRLEKRTVKSQTPILDNLDLVFEEARYRVFAHIDPEPMKNLFVFQMNDCDWVAAFNMEEAKSFYLKQCAGDEVIDESHEEYDYYISDPQQISFNQMCQCKFYDEETHQRRSFMEELVLRVKMGDKFPAFFASTEY